MIILKEKKKIFKEEDDYVKSSTRELLTTIKANQNKSLHSLFEVGPDRYLIKRGKIYKTGSGVTLFIDASGVLVGFSESVIKHTEKMIYENRIIFSFLVYNREFQLTIESY